jgi:hypothetical protein
MMSTSYGKTLRLHMPQWQGGNMHDHYFGSKLLAFLAPPPDGPVETVPVPEPKPGETLNVESGILGRGALIRQALAAAAYWIARSSRAMATENEATYGVHPQPATPRRITPQAAFRTCGHPHPPL